MPRQYQIHYKRTGSPKFAVLEPHVSAPLYNKPEVNDAIDHIAGNPSVVGMAVQVDNELFNIIVFNQEALAPKSFPIEEQRTGTQWDALNGTPGSYEQAANRADRLNFDGTVPSYDGPAGPCGTSCGCGPGAPGDLGPTGL